MRPKNKKLGVLGEIDKILDFTIFRRRGNPTKVSVSFFVAIELFQ